MAGGKHLFICKGAAKKPFAQIQRNTFYRLLKGQISYQIKYGDYNIDELNYLSALLLYHSSKKRKTPNASLDNGEQKSSNRSFCKASSGFNSPPMA